MMTRPVSEFGSAFATRAAFAVFGLAACTSSSDAVPGEGSALVGGQPAASAQFPATVFLKDGCTAAKVAPKRLLTAAHCVFDSARRRVALTAGSRISVTTDPARGFLEYEVAGVHVSPSWTQACTQQYCGAAHVTARLDAADVAVIALAVDLPDVPAVPVVSAPLAPGDHVTLTGFGCTDGARVGSERRPVPLAFAEAEVVDAGRAVHEGSPLSAADLSQLRGNYLLTAEICRAPV